MLEGLKIVKRSPYYRRLHPELQAPFPADAWHDDKWAFFVFELRDGEAKDVDDGSRLVVFTVDLERQSLEGVKVLTINAGLATAEVADLRDGSQRFSVPLPAGW